MLWNAAELALAAELAAQARAGPGTRRSRPVRLGHARRPHDMDVRVRGKGVRAAAVRSVSGACRSRSSAVGGPPLYVSSSSSSTVNGEVHAKDSKRLTRTKPPESLRNKPKQTMYGFGGSPVWTFMAAATGRRAGVVVACKTECKEEPAAGRAVGGPCPSTHSGTRFRPMPGPRAGLGTNKPAAQQGARRGRYLRPARMRRPRGRPTVAPRQ
jgi:hypothetical protein